MSTLNQGIARRISLRVPPLAIQSKIVASLTVYDELIQDNRLRIRLLEKLAEDIYREWFVRLLAFPAVRVSRFTKVCHKVGRE